MSQPKPLIVDVDGTFLATDMLLECFWQAMGRAPLACLGICLKHFGDRARLKAELAALAPLRVDLLPVNEDVKHLVEQSLSQGREVRFASGSDQSLVTALAEHHGIPGEQKASDGVVNLTGRRKAAHLIDSYGEKGFDYAGDGRVDRPVWQAAENAIIVGNHPQIAHSLAAQGQNVEEIQQRWRKRDLLRAMRPHQWVKNVLLFLPLLAAHRFDMPSLVIMLVAAIAFSFAASCIYLVNDLLDLEADRLHPTKQRRPFASGKVPITIGMAATLWLGGMAIGLAAAVNAALLGVVILYMGVSLAYSLRLKRLRWVDIATLASLYSIRVIAGAMAVSVPATGFLVAFIFPSFIALGCVKRLTELTLATSDERLPGRGYGRPDRGDLLNVAGLGTFGALLAFFLYSFTESAEDLYSRIWLLWLALIPIAAWLIRMVVLGWKGKQDYDPIVFAMSDKIGIALIIVIVSMMLLAS